MEYLFLERHKIPPGVEKPNFEKLASKSNFTVYELKRLFCRFCILCGANGNESGLVDKFTFLQQPELSFCSLAEFAFEYEQGKIKSQHTDGEPWVKGLNFELFVSLFSELSPLNHASKKAEYLFAILTYDSVTAAAQAEAEAQGEVAEPEGAQSGGEGDDDSAVTVPSPVRRKKPLRTYRIHKEQYAIMMRNLYKDTLTSEHIDTLIDSIWNNLIREFVVARQHKKLLKTDPNAKVSSLPAVTIKPKDHYIDKKEFVSLLSSLDLLQLVTIQL